MKQNKSASWLAIFAGLILISGVALYALSRPASLLKDQSFDGERAYKDVSYQVSLGPRIVETDAHAKIIQWMGKRLGDEGWQVEIQDTQWGGHRVQNVIAKRGTGKPWIVLGAHYDTRMWADQDPNITKRKNPVPGANDGASGVAILLELGRVLPKDLQKTVWLTFFDAEDNGDIPGYDWILGSEAFVAGLTAKPDAAIVVDMVGDKDLNIYMERNSNPDLNKQIWSQAAALGYDTFLIPQYKWPMEDDHTPFLQAGIPAVDIIDFDYPAWHTTMDTPDQVSAKSLQIVGETLRMWLIHS